MLSHVIRGPPCLAVLKAHVEQLDQERRDFWPDYQDHGVLFCWQHDVRHSYATAGRDARINWKALSQRIGYVDVASTMKPESQLEPVLGMTRHSTDAVASRGKRG
jgi:hypothetical protein